MNNTYDELCNSYHDLYIKYKTHPMIDNTNIKYSMYYRVFLIDIYHLLKIPKFIKHNHVHVNFLENRDFDKYYQIMLKTNYDYNKCNISIPCIVTETFQNNEYKYHLIDGKHRMTKMYKQNITESMFYVIKYKDLCNNISHKYTTKITKYIKQDNTEQDNTEQENNVKYIYNYNVEYIYVNFTVATKNPRNNNEYILPSYSTFTSIPKYDLEKEYLIYQKINDKWDIQYKIKNTIHFFNTKNYNKYFKTPIFYTMPYEDLNIKINKYIKDNNLNNHYYTDIDLPIYDIVNQSIYFDNNRWNIYDIKDNKIFLYLYDNNNYNKFFKKQIYYYNPSDKNKDIEEKIVNKWLTNITIPIYNINTQSIYFNTFINNWEIIDNNKIDNYKNKIDNLKDIERLTFLINQQIIIYKELLKETDWIFLKDIDILTDDCINNFKTYRNNIRTEIFYLKENLNVNFKLYKKNFIKPKLILKK